MLGCNFFKNVIVNLNHLQNQSYIGIWTLKGGAFFLCYPEITEAEVTISTEIVKIQRTLSRAVYKDAARLYRKGQLEAKFTKNTLKKGLFYAFFRFQATGSGRKIPEMIKFNSAHQELSIEVRFITVSILEPNLLKKGLFYAFFWFYVTGSGRKIPEMVKSNSAS